MSFRTASLLSRPLLMLVGACVCAVPAFAQSRPETRTPPDVRPDPDRESPPDLPLRRDIPDAVPGSCPAGPAARVPAGSAQNREESARLATDASNAAILGDLQTARDLLARAASLDPSDPDIAFRYARTLEELGETASAAREYCRYLSIAPEAPDAAEVTALVGRIAPPVRPGIPDRAVDDFRAALDHADSRRLAQAEHAFTSVIGAAPRWSAAWYNRGLVRAEARRREQAKADFMAFLELEPSGAARATVLDWVAQLDAPRTRYNPGTALAAGLLPGGGHFYTGRPVIGAVFLATAGGAAAFGILSQTRRVECLGNPQGGVCPPDQVRNESVERPHLIVGLGIAAGATILGAIDAARGARRRNAQEPIIRFGAAEVHRPRLLLPDVRSSGSHVNIALFRLRI